MKSIWTEFSGYLEILQSDGILGNNSGTGASKKMLINMLAYVPSKEEKAIYRTCNLNVPSYI